jgi:hypothetical protein
MPPPAQGETQPSPAGAPAEEWLPLGVFALAEEEKGDPTMFFQISVDRAGVINGAYSNTITATSGQSPDRWTKGASVLAGALETTPQRSLKQPCQCHSGRRSQFTLAKTPRLGCSFACPNQPSPANRRNFQGRRQARRHSRL